MSQLPKSLTLLFSWPGVHALHMAEVAFKENSLDELHMGFNIQMVVFLEQVSNRDQVQFSRLKSRIVPQHCIKPSFIEMLLTDSSKTRI